MKMRGNPGSSGFRNRLHSRAVHSELRGIGTLRLSFLLRSVRFAVLALKLVVNLEELVVGGVAEKKETMILGE